jgi:amino acid transporter
MPTQDTTNPVLLKTNVVGFLGAVTLGIVMLSPAMTLYGNFGPAFVQAGRGAPLAFLLALIATLPTATSYALLSRDFPDSGSAASWMSKAVKSPVLAKWAGWIVFLYYFNNFIIQPVTLGVFLNDLLTSWGFHPGFGSYALGAVICCVWPAWIVYRGISISSRGALRFLVVETAIVTALCITVILLAPSHVAGMHFSLDGFYPSSSPSGVPGLFRAMVFGMLAFCGFDVISTLSDEAKMSRKMIPQATFVALILFGAFIIVGVWGFSYAATPEKLKAVADAGGMPISDIARDFWGKWSCLVPITAISAALGIAIATAVGASRILYSMANKGLAPRVFAELHPTYRVPWKAMNLIFGVGLIAAVVTGALLGPYYAYTWWGTTSTFFAMITYFMVNIANLLLFRGKIFKSWGGFFFHGFVPVFGICADGYILVRSFFIELWNQGWANGQSVVVADVLCALIVLGIAFRKTGDFLAPSRL